MVFWYEQAMNISERESAHIQTHVSFHDELGTACGPKQEGQS